MEKPLSPTSPSDGAPAPGVLLCLVGADGSGAGRGQLSQAERATRALSDDRLPLEPLEIRLLAATLDYPATLRAVAAAFVPRFADWGFIYLVDKTGIPRREEIAYADPSKAHLAARFRSHATGPAWATLTGRCIQDGTPRLVQRVTEDVLRWAAHDEEHLAALQALAPSSMLILPLLARDRVIGGVTLMRAAHIPAFGEADLLAAQGLIAPAALALDNAQAAAAERSARDSATETAAVERDARIHAEQGALRLQRLQSVARSLASALAPETVGHVVFESGLSLMGAKTGTLALAKGETDLEIVHSFGWPHAVLEQWRTFRTDAPSLLAEAFRTRTPIWINSFEALSQVYPSAVALPKARAEEAWAALPLVADGRALGALGLGFAGRRHLDDAERQFVVALAALAAQAIVRAHHRRER
jgi:GAF domain-containing protein